MKKRRKGKKLLRLCRLEPMTENRRDWLPRWQAVHCSRKFTLLRPKKLSAGSLLRLVIDRKGDMVISRDVRLLTVASAQKKENV